MPQQAPPTRQPHRRRAPSGLAITISALLALAALLVPATPALAESRCVEDAAGDVEDRADGSTVAAPEADILAVCVSWDGQVLEVGLRVAAPTDPATSPDWEDFASSVGFGIDTDGITTEEATARAPAGEEFFVIFGRFPGPEEGESPPPEVRTMVAGTNDVADDGACVHTLLYDGVRYRARIPASCIDAPAEVQVAGFMFFRSSVAAQNQQGLYDEVPTFPAYLEPVDTEADPETTVTRLAGQTRTSTAIAVSQDGFADGQAESVVLARADAAPDALAAAPLAVASGAPLLLTNRDLLLPDVLAEIQRVLPAGGTVLISGGTAAIDESVADALQDEGFLVVRAAGDSRYTTSIEVARATAAEPQVIVVADGNDFPDALVGGALAAAEGGVQVLSNGDTLTDATAAYLAEHPDADVLAVGAAAAAAVPDATPLVGGDRFATSVVVAQRYADVTGVALASGTNFPDGLAGGAHAGRAGIPLLLSWPDVLPDAVAAHLADLTPVESVVMYGGTAALSHTIEQAAQSAFG